MFGRKKAEIEECATGLTLTLRPVCDLLLQFAATPIVPSDTTGAERAARASLFIRGLAAYALLRAVLQKRRLAPALQERCLDQVEYLLAEHADFADFDVDHLALQEYWQRVCGLRARKQVNVWFAIAETFLNDLGGGGLRGGDALSHPVLTYQIAQIARVYEQQLRGLEKRFRFV